MRRKVEDLMGKILEIKWSWVGNVARQGSNQWTNTLMQWESQDLNKSETTLALTSRIEGTEKFMGSSISRTGV